MGPVSSGVLGSLQRELYDNEFAIFLERQQHDRPVSYENSPYQNQSAHQEIKRRVGEELAFRYSRLLQDTPYQSAYASPKSPSETKTPNKLLLLTK